MAKRRKSSTPAVVEGETFEKDGVIYQYASYRPQKTVDLGNGWYQDKATGKKYRASTVSVSDGSGRFSIGETDERLLSLSTDEAAEQYLGHLNVPLSAREKEIMRQAREERDRLRQEKQERAAIEASILEMKKEQRKLQNRKKR